MSKFRKKPVIVEAVKWDGGATIPRGCFYGTAGLFIKTLEGMMRVSPGDWIITGVKGEKYPCKPDIFEAAYEPV